MKLAINKKMNLRLFNRAPINFWEPETVEEDSMTKTSYKDSICGVMRLNMTLTTSRGTHTKSILNPSLMVLLSNGSKQFMEDLNVVICGNGLDNNGPACFNLTHSSLKGKALCVFNDKAVPHKQHQWFSLLDY
jgi:hypothetical protein